LGRAVALQRCYQPLAVASSARFCHQVAGEGEIDGPESYEDLMTTLEELLQKKKTAIVRRWLDAALATYPKDASAAFGRQKDPFANPVGHSLRVGTQQIFDALLEGMDDDQISEYLNGIIKIRAVQQFSASRAVGFIFALKRAVRAELETEGQSPQLASALAKLDEQIDRIALIAFDVFVECRQQVNELRINEVKRQVAWVLEKMSKRDADQDLVQLDSKSV
jgi:hypothetical protein